MIGQEMASNQSWLVNFKNGYFDFNQVSFKTLVQYVTKIPKTNVVTWYIKNTMSDLSFAFLRTNLAHFV